jgi:hypothetical protein
MAGESSSDKNVKIAFQVDQQSADKAKRIIGSVIDEVDRLVKVTSKINFGGLGGGGSGGQVSSFSGKGGAGNVGTQMSQKVGGAAGGVIEGLTRSASATSAIFKSAGAGATGAFKIMGDSLRDLVSKSDREIGRLEGSLSKLEKTYTKLKTQSGRGMSGPGMNAVLDQNQDRYFNEAGQLAKARNLRATLQGQLDEAEPQKQGLFGRMRAGFGNFASNVQNGLQSSLGPFGLGAFVGAGAAALPAAAMMLTSGSGAFRRGNVDWAIDRPLITSQKEASFGGVFGGYAVGARNGDVATTHAIRQAAKDADFKEILGKHYTEALVLKAKLGNAVGIGENLSVGAGGIAAAASQRIGRGAERIANFAGIKNDNMGDSTVQEIDREKAMQLVAKYQPEKYAEMVANKRASDPLFAQTANSMYQGVFGNIGSINASRTSGNTMRDKNGNIIGNSFNEFQRRAMNDYWDPEQVAGMMGQLSQPLGRRLSGQGIAEKILGLNVGGFGSSANVFGAGSQFGRTNRAGGNALTSVFQGLTGAGVKRGTQALDISAGSAIGSMVAGSMTGGNFMGPSGEGFAETALNAAYAGGNAGKEMRLARAMPSGLAAMDSFASGSLDPLQGAVNMSAALKVAGNMPWETKKLLMSLDSASLMDILAKGKIPMSLLHTGITVPMVREYVSSRNGMAFARVNDTMLTPEHASIANAYRKGGIKEALKGFKTVEGKTGALADLANAMRTSTGHSFEADYTMFRLEAAGAHLLGGVRGRGAGRSVSKKSPYAAPAPAQGANAHDVGEYAGAHEGELKSDFAATPGITAPAESARQAALANATGDPEQMAENIGTILSAFARKMEELAGVASHSSKGSNKRAGRTKTAGANP